MKRCVISYATPGGGYEAALWRLKRSMGAHGAGQNQATLLCWTDLAQLGCPSHKEMPYAFKQAAFFAAMAQGYDSILWLDASMVVLRPLAPVFEEMERKGHIMVDSGWAVGTWISDDCMPLLEIADREDWFTVPMISGGFIGLSMDHTRSHRFLQTYAAHAKDGSFRGAWDNKGQHADKRVLGHRHDQTVASVIRYRLGMPIMPVHTWMAYTAAMGNKTLEEKSEVFVEAVGA